MRLYHLTAAHFALSNIALRRLKISRFADLNDPFELLAANLRRPDHRRAFEEWRRELNESNGLICFSKSWRNPLIWGHYAEKHTGIALGFDVPDYVPVDVIYTSSRVKIKYDSGTNHPVLNEALMDKLLRTKFVDWKYEDESRIFANLNPATREAGMYFKDFGEELALAEVILGPTCEIPIDRVRAVVEGIGAKVHVLKARMAYQSFRVVEDRTSRQPRKDA